MHFTNKWFNVSILAICFSILAGCNMVEGASQGARKDINAISNSMKDNSSH